MTDTSITRLHYFEKQFLRTQDFVDEQAYHVAMRRRHNIAHHVWGIVRGLEIVVSEDGAISVQPGLAVDGFGRELVLPRAQGLRAEAFDDYGSETLDVWLAYSRLSPDAAPPGWAGCGPPGAGAFYRWHEMPVIRLERPNASYPDRRRPQAVPDGDLSFSPARTPPDDPREDWPVFLGQITRDRTDPAKPVFTADGSDRPYAGLVGEAVSAPSGKTFVQIGSEKKQDDVRFAVTIPEAESANDRGPRLAIDKDGVLTLRGDTTVHGDLTVAGGALEFEPGTAAAASPAPWKIYHAEDASDGTHELRVEIDDGGTGTNQFVIGAFNPDENKFQECLIVDDSGVVTVKGDLTLEGLLIPNHPDPQVRWDIVQAMLTEEAKAFIAAGFLSGIGGASAVLSNVFRSPFGATSAMDSGRQGAQASISADLMMRRVAASLTDPNKLLEFASLLRDTHRDVAVRLREALGGMGGP
jgi:hypothetical protein